MDIAHNIIIYTMIYPMVTILCCTPKYQHCYPVPEPFLISLKLCLCLAPDHQNRVEIHLTYRIYFTSLEISDPFIAVEALIILLFWSEFAIR